MRIQKREQKEDRGGEKRKKSTEMTTSTLASACCSASSRHCVTPSVLISSRLCSSEVLYINSGRGKMVNN